MRSSLRAEEKRNENGPKRSGDRPGSRGYQYRHPSSAAQRRLSGAGARERPSLRDPQKSRFFGKFTWGVNLLREKIEDDRKKELSMQRDKKLLLLSLSHDIKTPLSAIKLNAKAIAKGIYNDEEKSNYERII